MMIMQRILFRDELRDYTVEETMDLLTDAFLKVLWISLDALIRGLGILTLFLILAEYCLS